MSVNQLAVGLALLGFGYSAALSAVLLIMLQKERTSFYQFLSGSRFEKGEKRGLTPLGDRIGELRKKWREPPCTDEKEGNSR